MDKYLVIVESPTKAKTIRKFLPKNYIVEASMGHVRDLPQSASDIPAKLKKEDWAKLGVNVEKNFEPLYVIPKGKSKIVTGLRKHMKTCKEIYLATDEDREGESISWHLMELLKPKIPVKRMVFHEITKSAIQKALEDTRQLDEKLVKAQEARRILDRLYGYTLSPLIWKKIAYGLSAGRVQSTGLRFIVERERERRKFVKSEYWDLKAALVADKKEFEAKLTYVGGKRIASGKDFDPDTGKLVKKDIALIDEKKAKELQQKLKKGEWKVLSVEEKESKTHPTKPFITSSLQMEGVRKLGMSAKQTMRTAQKLYEEGLITYMRTDSPNLSKEAVEGARSEVESLFGKDYLSDKVRQFAAKTKGAQEAHEAIRPAGAEFTHPDKTGLTGKEKQLYELIWKRTLASQMKEATKANMSVKIEVDGNQFNANGSRIVFPGFLRVYVEGSDDPDKALDDKELILPVMKEGQKVNCKDLDALPHETKPPARFTEASLVQRLEKEGVGRPSTYATIIGTIQDRGYVRKEGSALVPSFTGMAVVQLLEKYFESFVDYGFTSEMEEKLDLIAVGEVDYLKYLKNFYKGKNGLKQKVEDKEKEIKPEESRTIHLEGTNGVVDVKVGRFGPYVISHGKGKDEVHASIPEDIAPADLKDSDIDELIEMSKRGPEPIGHHPDNGEPIFCLVGRYGPYLQQGEKTDDNPKPRRASLPKGMTPKTIDMETAVKLLSLPRELGNHPETGKLVQVNNGKFGPYVMHDGEFRSLKKEDDVYTVGLERAVEILKMPKFGRGGTVVKDFGRLEELKKSVKIVDGKYGLYVKAGTKNYALPDELKDLEKVKKLTEAQVIKIIKDSGK
ncbi:MAG: type I DNA topoisomerase [Bacteriovoracaceae bacterium]|jgi:DNA topoisomerase-1|nr:DNA topoisomerase I [Halobacteriovoraceae bacterium]MDP7320471.1 type I DNA topoisomerase [Bacteriovoracaceae bacterium]